MTIGNYDYLMGVFVYMVLLYMSTKLLKQVSFLMCGLPYELADTKKFQRGVAGGKLADDTYINDISEINVLRMRQRCSRLWRGAGSASVVYSRQFNCFLTGADRSTEYYMMLHRRSLATSLQWRGHIHRQRSRIVPSTACWWWPEYHLLVRRNACLPLLDRASSMVCLPHRCPTVVRRDLDQLNEQPHSLLLQHKVTASVRRGRRIVLYRKS